MKVGEYVPPKEKLDDPQADWTDDRTETRSGAVQAPEALLLDPPRLLVLGEPGSGKTTLLKYLAVRIVSRDPAFGEFARKRVPNTWARWLDGMHRRLAALNLHVPRFLLLLGGLLAWLVGLFFSPYPIVGLLALVTLFVTCLLITARAWVAICSSVSVVLLVFFGVTHWMPGWSVGALVLALVLLLEAYWIRPFLRALRWLRDRSTNYPLPLYLTLNDQTGSVEPLDRRLARPLEDAGFADAQAFLRRRLESGKCLLLMDGLDEVVDSVARDRIAEWLGQTRIHARNPLLVTCRIAAFEAHPLEHRFSGFRRMEVQEFTDRQVESFIRNWFADRAPEEQQQRVAGLFAALGRNARMRLLAANPLLLSLIALVFERDWTLPDKRFELYDKCVDVLLDEWDKAKGLDGHTRFDQTTKRLVLQCLAVRFHEAGIRQFTQEDLLTCAFPAGLAGLSVADRDLLVQEIMLRSNLIRRKSRTSCDFAHLTFQEYFTARDFAERSDLEGLLAHLGDPWWREVILLFAGLQRDATGLLVRLRKHDLLVAASALADARTVATEEFSQVADGIVAELKSWLETNCGRRQEAADALAEVPRQEIRDYQAEQSRGEGRTEVALAAVLALGRCADRFTLGSLWPQRGPVLRLLHGSLRGSGGDSTQRVLTVLERLGFEWVFVPAGEFVMGEGPSQRRGDLGDYWMGKYPVTNAQFARFVEETKHQGAWRSVFTPDQESHPVVNVSWDDAMAFCRWAGVTLPSEQQWEKAARGTDGRVYPWGNRWDAGRCNSGGVGTTPVPAENTNRKPCSAFGMPFNWTEMSIMVSAPATSGSLSRPTRSSSKTHMPFHLYGLMTKMAFFMAASFLKEPHQPQDSGQQQAQHDAGHHREIKPEVRPFNCDVARQPSQPGDVRSQQPSRTDSRYYHPDHDQNPPWMLHGSFLPGFLGPCLLHLLPQVGKLGRRFSGGLTLVFGHVGGPPTQLYRWRARIGRMAASGFTDLDPVNTDCPAEDEAGHEKRCRRGDERLIGFLVTAVAISLSGVMAPGPITAATLAAGTRSRHAGALIALGHLVVELPLILLLVAGIGKFLQSSGTRVGIGLAGGAFLLLMGVQLLLSLRATDSIPESSTQRHPFWSGVVLTAANPYFLLWWATVGLTLAGQAMEFGLLVLGLFALVHWLCDLIWLEVLSLVGFKGTEAFGQRSQKTVSAVCGVLLLGFGLKFVWDAGVTIAG